MSWVSSMLLGILERLKEFYLWVWDTWCEMMGDLAETCWSAVESLMPSVNLPEFSVLAHWAEVANWWLPLDWAFTLWSAYLSIWSVVAVFRWILKIAPFVG